VSAGSAFQGLYDDYFDDVLRYCRYRLPTLQDAEDAVQEIFLHAYKALPGWRDHGNGARSWLFTIAHNEVVSRQRALHRRQQVPLDDADSVFDRDPSPEEQAVATGEFEYALALLQVLSEDQRRVMELRLVGLCGVEIADVLGKRHATVRKLQERALDRLAGMRAAQPARGDEPA
jgi:RNA polymerase sigma-70 factor (ECF subfamily)